MSKYGRQRFKITNHHSDIAHVVSLAHMYGVDVMAREIYLHEGASNSDEIDCVMATGFIKNLNILNNLSSKPILIHQQTPGGSWSDGMAIFNALQQSSAATVMIAYAHAKSMSSITLQAADKRVLCRDTEFMVHHGSQCVDDRQEAFQSAAAQAELNMDRMLYIYASRCIQGRHYRKRKSITIDAVKKELDQKMRMRDDWWMMPDEAIDYGFADGVLGEKGFEDVDVIRKCKRRRCVA